MFSRTVVIASALALLWPAVAGAQAVPSESNATLPTLTRTALPDATPIRKLSQEFLQDLSPKSPRPKDSLWNGALIGAGLGALAGALAGTTALDCSECAGFNVPLTFGVVGAAAGAGIGAGIDALRNTRSRAPVTTGRTRRLTVAPVFGKDVHAIVAWVRF